jgi:hypothetical protein
MVQGNIIYEKILDMTKFNKVQGKIMYDLMHFFIKSKSNKTSNCVKCEHIFRVNVVKEILSCKLTDLFIRFQCYLTGVSASICCGFDGV